LVVLIVLAPVSLLIFRAGGEAVGILSRPDAMKLDPHVLDGLVARVAATALLIGGFLVLGVLRAQSPEDAAIKAAFLRKLRRKGAA
jgi:hypothetical protein